MSEFEQLHPSLQYHVVNTLGWSTLRSTQLAAIAPIHAGTHCLLLAPTAGGKTEAAAIPILSRMLVEAWPATSVLYVCPIKALLNNLEPRLAHYAGLVGRRVAVWHGDISQSRRKRALKDAPDILLTTPESCEAMLISARVDRPAWFGNLKAVIVDELHAFADDDRGWHLRSVLHRLDGYLQRPLQRIGLSATVSNPGELLAWLAPTGNRAVVGSASVSTDADVTIDHVDSLDNAATVIAQLHRGEKRLVFCDSRSSAEQLSSLLRTRAMRTFVSHASLSLSERRHAEAAFSEERDCVIVATSTLELGVDVGDLDRVIQIDSPSSVSSFLQRMGRTGRRADGRRNCLFLTTNDHAFLVALGVTQKWSEAWVEAAVPPAEPWPIVAQQALALILERGELTTRELLRLLHGSFPELPIADIEMLVEYLVEQQFLDRAEGVVRVGPQTERSYARGHYRDLLASFSGSPLLTGRHGAAEIGYIDPTALTGERDERLLLLAGRSWRVTDVDWAKRIVWLEPAAGGGKARWIGSARSLGREVCQGIRSVLANGASPTVTLSRRARRALQTLADEIPASSGTHLVTSRVDGAPMHTWTFAGTRANRTLARQASAGAARVRFDALSVQAPLAALAATLPERIDLTGDELAAFRESIKFAACVPRELLSRTIVARNFELDGDDRRR
ncbi:DEAD/DEAH box helicase [Accumulibacter sp.]|uniref:DEAD/DEAH box helicase n=1 Tax=Accumulibacter sp. TaxID=2053492 RepID=UPI0025EF33B2|nr:DEAD/DEAH box helicase [Accumulibacter sp.]MCM8596148.1 DEAD/DEAH box helicase [Accumulibacter sp.]MCM8625582.1 DEAD/DEAH box helicase [Accumulibacter sp.]MDS4050297.1 DEAD/DEAH box helicase [Accumulibacter sp.]